ncbi:MAG: GntR family transcriptional regulator [Pseudomonadota bacterium]
MERRPDIYEQIQSNILDGTLRPGDRVKEAELAARFGLSRTPVREALRQLETRGLLTHQPHKGMVVAGLDASAVAELYTMREMIDGNAARLAAQHANEIEIEGMRTQIARDRALIEDPARLALSNRAFHAAILRAAHNRFLVKASDTLAEALALLGPTTLARPGRAAASIDEHAAVVAAISDRKPTVAEKAARAHIRASFAARLSQIDAEITESDGLPGN